MTTLIPKNPLIDSARNMLVKRQADIDRSYPALAWLEDVLPILDPQPTGIYPQFGGGIQVVFGPNGDAEAVARQHRELLGIQKSDKEADTWSATTIELVTTTEYRGCKVRFVVKGAIFVDGCEIVANPCTTYSLACPTS